VKSLEKQLKEAKICGFKVNVGQHEIGSAKDDDEDDDEVKILQVSKSIVENVVGEIDQTKDNEEPMDSK